MFPAPSRSAAISMSALLALAYAAGCSSTSTAGNTGVISCSPTLACPANFVCVSDVCQYTGPASDTGTSVDSAGATDTGGAADAGAAFDSGAAQNTGAMDTGAAQDTGAMDTGPMDAGSTVGYQSIVIYDKYTEPDCKKTTGPGPDIDMIAVWRGNNLLGVGKPGSCSYSAGANPACPDNKHATSKDVAAACGPFGDLDFKNVSEGYLSLGGGSLELNVGACTSATDDIEKCDGAGPAVMLLPGDEIDVYEIDQWYLGKTPGNKKAYITAACKCIPETYEVWVRPTTGSDVGSQDLGQKTGTGTTQVK